MNEKSEGEGTSEATDDGADEGGTRLEKKRPTGGDKGPGEQSDDQDEKSKKKLSGKTIVILVAAATVLLVGIILYWRHARQFVSTDDAYTAAHVHQVSSRVAGTVSEVLVDDNQTIRAGDVIVRLDPRDYQASLLQAQASVVQARATLAQQGATVGESSAQVDAAKAQEGQARAQITQADAQLTKAQLDYDRGEGLFERDRRAIARADVDAASAALKSAQGAADQARAGLSSALAQTKAAQAAEKSSQAQVDVAEANLTAALARQRAAELQLSYCQIAAPVDGKISRKTVEAGQRLTPGQALLSVVSPEVWVIANLKETQLGRVEVGQRVNVEIDALSGRTFYATVHSIQEGSGATFALLPPDNATGNFTKIVQRVPVKIVFDRESIRDFKDKIVPGLSVVPTIDLESLEDTRRETKRQKSEQEQNQDQAEHREKQKAKQEEVRPQAPRP